MKACRRAMNKWSSPSTPVTNWTNRSDGRNPLMFAVRREPGVKVAKLRSCVLCLMPEPIPSKRSDWHVSLCWAAGFGDLPTVKELIQAGAGVEVVGGMIGFTHGSGPQDSMKIRRRRSTSFPWMPTWKPRMPCKEPRRSCMPLERTCTPMLHC